MKSINCKVRTNFVIQVMKNIKSANDRIKKILHAKYEKVNLKEIRSKKLKYLNSDEVKKHENMFDGTLGNYTSTAYKIEHPEGAQIYHAKPFPIHKVHE